MSDSYTETDIITKLKVPSLWKVIIYNNDMTPVDFVIAIIHKLFNKSIEEATRLAYEVHYNGKANVGVFTKEVASVKASLVIENANNFGYPLLAMAEEA